MTDHASILAEARHGMSVLFGELTALRDGIAQIPDDFDKVRDAARDAISRMETFAMDLHDKLSGMLTQIETEVDKLVSSKGASDSKFADLETRFEAVLAKLQAANSDAPASGSATGSVAG